MTNEEAIKELEHMKRHTIDFLEIDVFDKAIEALRRHDVPDTNVGDMISRQAAIDTTWKEPSYSDPINILTEVRDRIESLPSAEPEYEIVEEYLQAEKNIAYMQGKIDGIKECTKKLRAVRDGDKAYE